MSVLPSPSELVARSLSFSPGPPAELRVDTNPLTLPQRRGMEMRIEDTPANARRSLLAPVLISLSLSLLQQDQHRGALQLIAHRKTRERAGPFLFLWGPFFTRSGGKRSEPAEKSIGVRFTFLSPLPSLFNAGTRGEIQNDRATATVQMQ